MTAVLAMRAVLMLLATVLAASGADLLPADLLRVTKTDIKETRDGSFSVQIGLRNLAPQQITAFGISATAKYSNGKTFSTTLTTDNLSLDWLEQSGLLSPGQTKLGPGVSTEADLTIPPDTSVSSRPVIEVSIDLVAFQDGTVYGDPARMLQLQKSRESEAALMDLTDQALESISQSADPLQKLPEFIAAHMPEPSASPNERQAQRRSLSNLQALIEAMLRSGTDLTKVRRLYQSRSAFLREHLSSRKSGGQNR